MNKFINNRFVHQYAVQDCPTVTEAVPYDWQKYLDSVENLSALRRICAFPYVRLIANLANEYSRDSRYLENLDTKPAPLWGWYWGGAKAITKRSYEFYSREFEACCAAGSRRPLNDLAIELIQDTKKYLRSATRLKFSLDFFALPFAALYLTFLVSLQILAELFLAGTAKEYVVRSYKTQAEHFGDPREIHDLAVQIRPIALLGLYAAPFTAVILMARQLVTDTVGLFLPRKKEVTSSDCVRFRQNPDRKKELGPPAFFLSPVFGWTLLFFCLAGIPGFISFWLYNNLGIDALLGFPSHNKDFAKILPIILLYIYPLSVCLTTLFFTGYFTYLCNFTSTEYEI